MPLASRRSSSRALRLAIAFLAVASSRGLQGQDRGIDILSRQATGDPSFNAGRQYAVVIGIDKYEKWPQLKGAVLEAKAFKAALASRYVIDRFYELYDEDATAAGLRRLFIETLPRELGPRDSLLVFYSGRGRRDAAGAGSWIAADGSKDSLSQGGWIQNSQMRGMVSRLAAKRILIVADACFAADPLDSGDQGVDVAAPAVSLGLTARLALSSGADETPTEGSEFGRQLVAVLGRDETGVLDAAALAGRLRLGSSKIQPSLGALPGNEKGAGFALFLKSAAEEALPSAARADSAPARLSFPSFGVALVLTGMGSERGADNAAASPDRVVWKVSSLSPVHLDFASPYAERLDLPPVEGPFSEGEERDLQVPSGRIALPWLPAGSKVGIGGGKARLELANQAQTGFLSPELPAGTYVLSVEGPAEYRGRVMVVDGAAAEPADYRSSLTAALGAGKAAVEKDLATRRARTIAGWASLATGVLGAAGAGTVYLLGASTVRAYRSAATSSEASAAALSMSAYEILFPVCAVIGGVGLGASPILLLAGPNRKALERSMNELDEGIQALRQ